MLLLTSSLATAEAITKALSDHGFNAAPTQRGDSSPLVSVLCTTGQQNQVLEIAKAIDPDAAESRAFSVALPKLKTMVPASCRWPATSLPFGGGCASSLAPRNGPLLPREGARFLLSTLNPIRAMRRPTTLAACLTQSHPAFLTIP